MSTTKNTNGADDSRASASLFSSSSSSPPLLTPLPAETTTEDNISSLRQKLESMLEEDERIDHSPDSVVSQFSCSFNLLTEERRKSLLSLVPVDDEDDEDEGEDEDPDCKNNNRIPEIGNSFSSLSSNSGGGGGGSGNGGTSLSPFLLLGACDHRDSFHIFTTRNNQRKQQQQSLSSSALSMGNSRWDPSSPSTGGNNNTSLSLSLSSSLLDDPKTQKKKKSNKSSSSSSSSSSSTTTTEETCTSSAPSATTKTVTASSNSTSSSITICNQGTNTIKNDTDDVDVNNIDKNRKYKIKNEEEQEDTAATAHTQQHEEVRAEVVKSTKAATANDVLLRRRRRRKVRFSRKVVVRNTRSHHDYTPRQIKNCWYQQYEIEVVRDECLRDIQRNQKWKKKKMKQLRKLQQHQHEEQEEFLPSSSSSSLSSLCDDTTNKSNVDKLYTTTVDSDDGSGVVCMRGLESYEPVALKRKKQLRMKATRIVFDVEDDGGDDLTIAEYYTSVTQHCVVVAHLVALQDERDAAVAVNVADTAYNDTDDDNV